MKTSEKVILLLYRIKMTKTELSKKLGCSRPTLNNKIKTNFWDDNDLLVLKNLGMK